jgi:hypothetical protein
LLQGQADRKQKVDDIARFHEVEQDRLSIELRCDLENCVLEPRIAVMGRMLLVEVLNTKTVSVSDAVTKWRTSSSSGAWPK